jgi:hypothetical protein
MDDWECPVPATGSTSLGYCDRAQLECKTDCRTGNDPVTGRPYDDCITGYQCVNQNGANACQPATCGLLGGARTACNSGQYCCGEDKDLDGTPDPCPSSGILPNQCYTAPRPPFCTTCTNNTDCRGASSPSGSALPSFCVAAGNRPDGSPGVKVCAPATFNDFSIDAFGIPKALKGCPAKWAAVPVKVDCTRDSDCDPPGQPGAGVCGDDLSVNLANGTHPKACLCPATGAADSISTCPSVDSGSGPQQTFCRYAPSGSPTQCVQSVVCVPPSGGADTPVAQGGCGL